MGKKEKFVLEIEQALKEQKISLSEDAQIYFEALKGEDSDSPRFTENGKAILKFIQENKDTYNNLFKAKDIGEGMGISSRTASGSLRKLVNDGFVEKLGENPKMYSLTEEGESVTFDSEEA